MNTVEHQYQTAQNLNTRISIHDKYSTNPLGFGNWIVSHYCIRPSMKVLELGCGTGSMWKNHLDLTDGAELVLTDFSPGMLSAAQENLPARENVTFRQVDIQDIPFPDGSFDLVIANMMLYHVPDLDRGLGEVRRVLKPGGTFCCATYGEHGIVEFVANLLRESQVTGHVDTRFTLQNGGKTLSRHFAQVRRELYEDSLAITNIGDFIEYIYSLSGLTGIAQVERTVLETALERSAPDGVLHVPKEYGMFLCQ